MPDKPLRYELLHQDPATRARLGRVTTRHGHFDTPAFMPVGTQGTVKGILPDHVAATGSQIILANTYHLMLRPGEKTVAELGDLHKFMSWPGPILTDSGGYQVFSLADINKIDDAGVVFKSHIDGNIVKLTPQRSMQIQNDLGADIIMAFDECPDPKKPVEYQQLAVDRTLRWAELCLSAHARPNDQSLFGIVQGGTNQALREQCAAKLIDLNFPGYALGGLAVGEGFQAMKQVLADTTPLLPPDKPRYLMGVGFPRDIIAAVRQGIDMFDCTMPTRNGRNAYAFTASGALRLRNSKLTRDPSPIEPGCDCYACQNFSRGAIRHFFFASEMLGPILVSVHNIRFYQRLMADVRQSIRDGRFDGFCTTDPRARLGPAGEIESVDLNPNDQAPMTNQ
ncbi:MAG TPA: tRNA guanosine(34) transglycosylase Tgt [Tepidisphaeraceae bacterium]|jgi:queuine tRNA-ribosyltransferase|nr:tRNA guanosine(34) transglycosylase Tgt [Tepidisphaeraceae bacterium]